MTDKELIKQEIERKQKDIAGAYESEDTEHGYKQCCKEILKFIDSLQEEPASEDLEEAANKWNSRANFSPYFMKLGSNGKPNGVGRIRTTHADSFKAGAEWQKQQMMKDAFIDDYTVHDGRIELEGDPLPSVEPIIILPYPKFKPNDKVKLIIKEK